MCVYNGVVVAKVEGCNIYIEPSNHIIMYAHNINP